MATLPEIMRTLNDPDKYVRIANVPIFDEHEEEDWEDKDTGEPARPNAPGAKKITRSFSRQDLQRIANNCNRRDRTGTLSPLTIGHTDPRERDEKKQPEIVGYVNNYRVRYDPAIGSNVIAVDYHIRKDKFDRASEYPRTSIELWPSSDGEEIIDPVAILKRTPKRDLGQWLYRRPDGTRVLRYAREFPMPDTPIAAPELEHDPEHAKITEQFMRHVFSHPHAKLMCEKYAEPLDEPDGDELTEPPDAEAPSQFNAYPSETNAFPFDEEEEPVQHRRNGVPSKQIRRDSEATRFARLEREVTELRKERADLRKGKAMAYSRQVVTQLEAEGYLLDPEEEVKELMALPDDKARDIYANKVRKRYSRAPIGGGFVRTADLPSGNEIDLDDPEGSLSEADQHKLLQYQKQHNCWDFEKAARAVFPTRFARNGTN